MTIEEAKTVPIEVLSEECNRLFPAKAQYQLWLELIKISTERQLEKSKQNEIDAILEGIDNNSKQKIAQLLMLLPLSTLKTANSNK